MIFFRFVFYSTLKSGWEPVTVIEHDQAEYGITSIPGQSDGCSSAGCYSDKFYYGPKMDQIVTLMDISATCQQHIVNNCTGNALSHLAWWTDRNGNRIEYWDGSHSSATEGCKCSLDGFRCTPNALGDSVSLKYQNSLTIFSEQF